MQPLSASSSHFGWEPKGPYKKLDIVTVAEITASLHVDMEPPMIVPVKELNPRLPLTFESLPPRETIVTVAEITASLHVDMEPPMVDPVKEVNPRLPLTFESLPPRETINEHPHKEVPHVASIHDAARHRGVDKCKVSFYFGGSNLEMLATRKISKDKDYLVALVPGTDTIMIASHKEYTSD